MTTPNYDIDFYSDDVISDPFPVYRKMRELGPVVFLPKHNLFAVSRYEEVSEVLRQPLRFSSSRGVSPIPRVNEILVGSTLNSDPPEHDLTRSVTSEPLLPGALAEIKPRINMAAEGLIETLCQRGEFDAIADLAQFLPVTIVAELVGLPDQGRENMLRWASATFNLFGDENTRTEQAFEELTELRDFLDEYGRPEKLKPGSWAQRIFEVGSERGLSYQQCAQLMRDYINPSLDTTISVTGQIIKLFADNPEQWRKVCANPGLIPNAVEEAVRLSTPIRAFTRYVTEECEIAGSLIPKDSRLLVVYASANRDEEKFENAEHFDVTRDVHDHLGFGQGVHMCMGMHLARIEMIALLEALQKRVSEFTLTAEPEVAMNNTIRAFSKMPVRVTLGDSPVLHSKTVQGTIHDNPWLDVKIAERKIVADNIIELKLEKNDQAPLPTFEAGAHIDVRVKSGIIRQYSLLGDPFEQGPYRIGVLLTPDSRGGSAGIHSDFQEGTKVRIGRPRNNFGLNNTAEHTILFAGGIGITPILSMAYNLTHANKSFELHYCVRSGSNLAFTEELRKFGDHIHFHTDDGVETQKLNIANVLSSPNENKHLYVCGPTGFMDFVVNSAENMRWQDQNVHLERFGAEVDSDGVPFTVIAAKSGVTFEVQPGEFIADKLIENGVDVQMSCQSGVCGTCLTRVIAGTPDHRDLIMTDSEKANNDQITVCCSRSKTKTLTLDL